MVFNFELEMKTKVAVPNSRNSKESKVEANSTESESVDKRSTEKAVSSPVIKVYGSSGVEATLAMEVTKAEVTEAEVTKAEDGT